MPPSPMIRHLDRTLFARLRYKRRV